MMINSSFLHNESENELQKTQLKAVAKIWTESFRSHFYIMILVKKKRDKLWSFFLHTGSSDDLESRLRLSGAYSTWSISEFWIFLPETPSNLKPSVKA